MKYSIITINFNNKDGLRKTIESVVNQTYKDFEYIIIDGGSTDGSVEVIKEYIDKIDYWVSEPDKGIYNAMNKGVLQSHGEYLNFMNSGDCFYDIDVLKDVCRGDYSEDIITGRYIYSTSDKIMGFRKIDISLMDIYRGRICHQATFFSRSLFKKELYDESYRIVSDWKYYVKALVYDNCSFRQIERIVTLFDYTGISSDFSRVINEHERAVKELFPPRIIIDYERYKNVESPLLDMIPEFNRSIGFHKFICANVSFLIKLRKFIYSIIGKKCN